jgi:hypothetical protein
MFDEAMDKYERGEISLDQLRSLPDMQAAIEGITEMLILPEGKIISKLLSSNSKELALKSFFKSKTGKELVSSFGKPALNSIFEGTKIAGGEITEEFLGNYLLDKYNYEVKKDNPDYKYQNEFTIDNNILTAVNTFVSMLPTILM